jgi:flagellin-like hook-associated protein FlgL
VNISQQVLVNQSTHHYRQLSGTLTKTLLRINSGQKIMTPADDAHRIVQAAKVVTNQEKLGEANNTIDTGISYAQQALGIMQTLHENLSRMSEIATLANQQMHGSKERAMYAYEFNQLAQHLKDALGTDDAERFEFVEGFQPGDTFQVTINGVEFDHEVVPGDTPATIRDSFITQIQRDETIGALARPYAGAKGELLVSVVDKADTLTFSSAFSGETAEMNQTSVEGVPGSTHNGMEIFADKAGTGPKLHVGELPTQTFEIPEAYLRVADHMIQLAGREFDFNDEELNSSQLVDIVNGAQDEISSAMGEMAGAKISLQRLHARNDAALINLESALSKFMDADIAEESSKLAKYEMLAKSSTAMLAQANFTNEGALQLLG